VITEAQTIDMPAAVLRNVLPQAAAAPKIPASPAKPLPIFAEQPAGLILLPLIAAALWALAHCYPGIVGDASVYIGRALADLDPAGVGRDLMFVYDGQSRFSLFPLVLRQFVAVLGPERTGLLLALLSMAAEVAAVATFAACYVRRPLIAIVVIFVAVLDSHYGTPWRFCFSEVIAVPRPFAEVLVLFALAALACRRTSLGFVCVVAASLIHPLMALAGWGVFAIVLSCEDRRWCAAFVGAALLLIAGAAADVPLLHRLVTVMDPHLKAFAESRSPLLFPTAWSIGYLGGMLAEAASLAIAASFVDGRRRTILVAAIFVGVGGVMMQALLGDRLSLTLVIQAQLWRMVWLMAALAAAALAFCALELWRNGPRGHIILALLSIAWLMNETPEWAGLVGAVAVALHFAMRRLDLPVTWTSARALWVVACLLALVWNIHYFVGYVRFMADIPPDAPHGLGYFWSRRYVAFAILGLVLLLAYSRPGSRAIIGLAGAAAVLLIAATCRYWDDRGPFQKLLDASRHPSELVNAIATRPGEVLWVDGLNEAWFLTGRPQWASLQQGVSTIFSPELTTVWRERMQFLIREDLAPKNGLSSFHIPSSADLPHLTEAGVTHLCSRPDAPAWIIAPLETGVTPLAGRQAQIWHLPQPQFKMTDEGNSYVWHRIEDFLVLSCAAQ
jgi:hypothetical protein